MTTTLLINPELENALIVYKLVGFASDDESAPPDWELEKTLRQLEKDIFPNTVRFALICEQARSLLTGLQQDARILFLLGQINGLRRVDPCDTEKVRALMATAEEDLARLAESPRRGALSELYKYHAGIFLSEQGDYDRAEQLLKLADREAYHNGNAEGAVINRFRAQVEQVNHALVRGDKDSIEHELRVLQERYQELQRDLARTTKHTQWRDANGPIHVLIAHFWAGMSYADRRAHTDKICNLDSDLAHTFASWISLLTAVNHFCSLQDEQAVAQAGVVERGNGAAVIVASAWLVQARVAMVHGQRAQCRRYLQNILDLQKPGIHQLKAVARRELEVVARELASTAP